MPSEQTFCIETIQYTLSRWSVGACLSVEECTNNNGSHITRISIKNTFFILKSCGTVLKKAPPAAARETLPIVTTKLESTAQYGEVSVSPKMSKSWLIRKAAQYLRKMKEETVGEKKEGPWTLSTTYLIYRAHGPV